jgi:hypothetical protein
MYLRIDNAAVRQFDQGPALELPPAPTPVALLESGEDSDPGAARDDLHIGDLAPELEALQHVPMLAIISPI